MSITKKTQPGWYDRLTEVQRQEVDEVISDFHSGKLPAGISLTAICREIRDAYELSVTVDRIARWFRERQ